MKLFSGVIVTYTFLCLIWEPPLDLWSCFSLKKIWGEKNFKAKKKIYKNFGVKIFWVKQKFLVKKIWVKKFGGQKKFWG